MRKSHVLRPSSKAAQLLRPSDATRFLVSFGGLRRGRLRREVACSYAAGRLHRPARQAPAVFAPRALDSGAYQIAVAAPLCDDFTRPCLESKLHMNLG